MENGIYVQNDFHYSTVLLNILQYIILIIFRRYFGNDIFERRRGTKGKKIDQNNYEEHLRFQIDMNDRRPEILRENTSYPK